jgi:hypothetical protein
MRVKFPEKHSERLLLGRPDVRLGVGPFPVLSSWGSAFPGSLMRSPGKEVQDNCISSGRHFLSQIRECFPVPQRRIERWKGGVRKVRDYFSIQHTKVPPWGVIFLNPNTSPNKFVGYSHNSF